MISPINHIRDAIKVGVQTDNDVEVIGFDLKPWVDALPGMSWTVMATRPGESEAYPVKEQMMVGTVLYWHPDGYDTELAGEGKVEIVGVGENQRKLSGPMLTTVNATSVGATKEPGESAAPWYEAVLKAAEELANDINVGIGGLYLVNVTSKPGESYKADRTHAEVIEAIGKGLTVLMVRNGKVYPCTGVVNGRPTFDAGVVRNGFKAQTANVQITEDERIVESTSSYFKAANPEALTIEQDGETSSYDGSNAIKIKIPNPVTDEHINSLIDQKLANSGGSQTILAETTVHGEEGLLFILTPPASVPVVDNIYTVTYNGTPYDCLALTYEEDGVDVGVMLGNSDAMGVPGGNPNAPFLAMFAHEPQDMDGAIMYGRVVAMDGATSATISVEGEGGSSNSTPQIILTIDADGNVTSNTPFGTAWAMTPGELQAAIVIKESSQYKGTTSTTVETVSKVEGALGGAMASHIHLRIRKGFVDDSDMGDRDNTRFLSWAEGNTFGLSNIELNALPIIPHNSAFAGRYLRYDGRSWIAVTIDQLKADLGLT